MTELQKNVATGKHEVVRIETAAMPGEVARTVLGNVDLDAKGDFPVYTVDGHLAGYVERGTSLSRFGVARVAEELIRTTDAHTQQK